MTDRHTDKKPETLDDTELRKVEGGGVIFLPIGDRKPGDETNRGPGGTPGGRRTGRV